MSSYVAISLTQHKNKNWIRHQDFSFSKNDNIAPLYANELPDAIHSLPIAFAKHESGYSLVALLGLRDNENLLVTDKGQWIGRYIPIVYRSRPFQLVNSIDDDSKKILCIENDSVVAEGSGEDFFDDQGNLTSNVEYMLNLLSHYNSTYALTQRVCSLLEKHHLLTPWNIVINDGEADKSFTGLYSVNEDILNSLPNEIFLELRNSAALPVIYSQLLSMSNINPLTELFKIKIRAEAAAKQNKEANDTFSFIGI